MAKNDRISVCLYKGYMFRNFQVTTISAETTDEEVRKKFLRSESLPDKTIDPFKSANVSYGTS